MQVGKTGLGSEETCHGESYKAKCKSEKIDQCQKKSVMMGGIRQNVLKMHELENLNLHRKKPITTGDTRQNVFKACELGKLNLCQKKPTTMEGTSQRSSRHMGREA